MSETSSNDDWQQGANDIISAINAAEHVKVACSRAVNLRQLFACSEIASKLASGPSGHDRNQWFRVLSELALWCNSGAFTSDEILALGGDPVQLQPLHKLDGGEVTIDLVRALLIPPPACKRFLERNDAENAPRLLRAWLRPSAPENLTLKTETEQPRAPAPEPGEPAVGRLEADEQRITANVSDLPSPGAARPKLHSRDRDLALRQWIEATFNAKIGATENLPGRGELLTRARREVTCNVNETDVRKLRADYASPDAKKGGATQHRRRGEVIE